jgi:3'(2'), 5'-bisphosphate nucleotidase
MKAVHRAAFFVGISFVFVYLNNTFILHSLLPEYHQALLAAAEASRLILEVYGEEFDPDFKTDGSPVTKADLRSSEYLHDRLERTGIPVTGEERLAEEYSIRKEWKRLWCVDPLDGTKEFVKRNGEFSVNIALIENQQPVFGIIAWPVKDQIIFGGKETGVFISETGQLENTNSWVKLNVPSEVNDPITVTCSRSHHSGPVLEYLNGLKTSETELSFIKMGSALKFFALAKGEADTYPRFAPTMEWDIAAGQAILEALGGSVCHAETGEPLIYNKVNLRNPYFIASTKAFREWRRL